MSRLPLAMHNTPAPAPSNVALRARDALRSNPGTMDRWIREKHLAGRLLGTGTPSVPSVTPKPQGGVGTWNGIPGTSDLVYRPGQTPALGSSGKPYRPEAVLRWDKDGNQVDLNGNILHRKGDPVVQLLGSLGAAQPPASQSASMPADEDTLKALDAGLPAQRALNQPHSFELNRPGVQPPMPLGAKLGVTSEDRPNGPMAGSPPPPMMAPPRQQGIPLNGPIGSQAPIIPRPAPGNPGYDGLNSDQVIDKARQEAQSQLDDPNYIPTTQQGWEAKQARQNELAGQRRAASVADMLSGGGTRAMNENGMPIVNGSGAPLPNTVRGSVGSDGAPVYRPDGTRMVEPVGGWNPNQMTESTPLSPQAQGLRDAMQKRYDAAQAARQQTLMARINGQLPPATGPRADSSNPRWMAAREARQERRDAARALIAQRGMAEAANRTARIEARRAATLPPNPLQMMAMRNPALALGMQRMALDAQQANLDRAIQREELDIRRSALTGDLDERKQARLDAMKQQQAENDLKRQQLDQQGELGRAGIAQDQAQHDERMAELRNQNSRYDAEQRRDREDKRAALRAQIASQHNDWSDADIDAEVDRMFPPSAPGAAPAGPAGGAPAPGGEMPPRQPGDQILPDSGKPYYKPGQPIPPKLRDAAEQAASEGDPSAFARMAKRLGYDDNHIDMMWREITGNPSSSVAEPTGPTFGGALWDYFAESGPSSNPFGRWWNNPGNRR